MRFLAHRRSRMGHDSSRCDQKIFALPRADHRVRAVSSHGAGPGFSRSDGTDCGSNCGDGQIITVRAASSDAGSVTKWNSSSRRLTPSRLSRPRRAPDVFPRLPSRDHCSASAVGVGIFVAALPVDVLLQLLERLVLAADRPCLDIRKLSRIADAPCLLADATAVHVDRGASDAVFPLCWDIRSRTSCHSMPARGRTSTTSWSSFRSG